MSVHRLPLRPRVAPATPKDTGCPREIKIGTLHGSIQLIILRHDGFAAVFEMSPEEALRFAGRLEINAVMARMGLPHGDI